MRQFDVTIVGAGLAGLQCARLLADAGLAVLLVDRKKDLEQGIHTTGIFVRRTVEDFDFPPASLGPPVRRVRLVSPAGRTQTLESSRDEFRVGRMKRIYSSFLQRAVDAGVEWQSSTHFRGLGEERDGLSMVRLEDEQGSTAVATRFLVGADGARSRVARALGLSENRRWIVGVEEVIHGADHGAPPALHCFLDPVLAPGYIGWVADDGESLHLGVGGHGPSFSPSHALGELRRRVARIFEIDRGRVVERRGGLIPVGGVLPRISSPRGLLLGDAAGAVSPLTAGGLDGAMRLSRFAAELLVAASSRDGGSELLALYSGVDLRTRFLSRRWMRAILDSVRSPMLVEAGCALLRTPPLSLFASHLFFGRGSFPEPCRPCDAWHQI